jgi:serine/threonine protein kinase
VLVQKEYFKNSNSIGYHYDLADLGEGKSIESSLKDVTRLSGTQSFGILEYQAPEVATEGYGPATDMYAFGRLAIDMVRFNHQCFVEDDQGTIRIPGKLADILELCLDDDPAERLEAVLVGFMLEEVQQNIRDGEAEWVDSEEFLSRPSAGSKLLSLASTIRSSPMNQRSELIDQAGSST